MNVVYVVLSNYWNSEHDAIGVDAVFANEKDAVVYCESLNKKRTSSYSTEYTFEGFLVG